MKIKYTILSLIFSAVCLVYTGWANYDLIQMLSTTDFNLLGDFKPSMIINDSLTMRFLLSMLALIFSVLAILKKQMLAIWSVVFAIICWLVMFIPIWFVMVKVYM